MGDSIKFLAGCLVGIAYVGAIVALAWHGTLTGDQALGAAGAVVLPIIGAAIHSNGTTTGAQAASGEPAK